MNYIATDEVLQTDSLTWYLQCIMHIKTCNIYAIDRK